MELQRVWQDWMTELNYLHSQSSLCWFPLMSSNCIPFESLCTCLQNSVSSLDFSLKLPSQITAFFRLPLRFLQLNTSKANLSVLQSCFSSLSFPVKGTGIHPCLLSLSFFFFHFDSCIRPLADLISSISKIGLEMVFAHPSSLLHLQSK